MQVKYSPGSISAPKFAAIQCAILLLLLLTQVGANAWAEPAVLSLRADTGQYPLGKHLEILRDRSGTLDIQTVVDNDHWYQSPKEAVSLGLSDDDWWFRFSAHNEAPWDTLYLLEAAYSSLDYVNVYVLDDGAIIQQFDMGDHFPFHARPIDHHNFITPINWPVDKTLDVYVHVRTSGVVQLPLTLWWQADFAIVDQQHQMGAGLYFGAMLIMIIYNLFMYFGIKDRSFIYYVGFVASISLFVASLTGYSYQYFWPEASEWNGKSIGFFLSSAVLFAVLFTHRFLDMDAESWPLATRGGILAIYFITVIMMVSSILLPYTIMLVIVIVGAVIACFGALILGGYGWIHGEIAARYYVLAWGSLLVGGIVLAGNKFSVIPQNIFTDNAVQIGSSMLVALLSFAIADRINEERRRRYNAQRETISHERAAREAKEDALSAQQQANRELEEKVRARTEELHQANAILEEMNATDALTGLRNRRFFDDIAKREYVRCFRYQRPIALIFADIDHFKKLNDTYGHLIGDDGLRVVAQIMANAAIRDSDVVARYGGEEFCILLPETEMAGAVAVAERIRRTVEDEEFVVNGKRVPITMSLGVSCHQPKSPDNISLLIKEADESLYNAKGAGRNRVCQFGGKG